jgi:predicted nucleic acid-binding protein
MNQLFKNDREELTARHEEMVRQSQDVDNVSRAFWKHDRKINAAKREISIFMNASKRIKDMDIDKVSIEYLQEALQSVLGELEK